MTKQEAIKALKEGKELKHRYFSENEWVRQQGCIMIFEDNVRCPQEEFWRYRTDTGWETGWKIVSENQD